MTPFAAFLTGLLVWSLGEYLVHRFVLHGRLCARYHAIHHHDPLDGNGVPYILVAPFWFGCIIAGLTFFGASGGAFFFGLTFGYVAYVVVHEQMHRHPDFMAWNNRLHDLHHDHWRCNYGVTTPLWDWVFGTLRKS